MVQVVPDEKVAVEVYRYLLPSERHVITMRRHPAVLFPAAFAVVGDATALVFIAAGVIAPRVDILVILSALLPLFSFLFYQRVRAWLKAYVVFTGARIMLINLKWRRPLVVIPLAEAYNTVFIRLTPLRPFSLYAPYGSFIIGKDSKRKRVQKLKYLPYPEQLYIEVSALLFPDPGALG